MPYYVYIIQSAGGTLYKGFSKNYLQRLREHNDGKSTYTSSRAPWKLVYVEEHNTKREALIREKKIKRCNTAYLHWLFKQPSNILNRET